MSDHPVSGQFNPQEFDQGKIGQTSFMYFGNLAAVANIN